MIADKKLPLKLHSTNLNLTSIGAHVESSTSDAQTPNLWKEHIRFIARQNQFLLLCAIFKDTHGQVPP